MGNKDYFLTWSSQRGGTTVSTVGGQGVHLKMSDGSSWLDLGSLSYQGNLGFGHPDVVSAIQKQAGEMCLTMPNASFPVKDELARRLLELAPEGFTKVFFTLGGSEANENAMKIARLATGRHKFLARYRSYHGASLGALGLTGDFRRPPLEPGIGNVVHILGQDAAHLEEVMELEGRGSIAAVFMEPIPGANGVLLPSPDYWPRMRAACDDHGTLLVADEVLTGFGRTGRCFGFEHEGVVPDMITVAKGLTAGYAPLGAVLVHERVASYFDDAVLYAGLTNYAHPLCCAAALASLKVYEAEDLYTRAATLEPGLLAELEAIARAQPDHASSPRGRGLLAALDIKGDPAFWERLGQAVAKRRLLLHLSERRGTAIFAPPLIIDKVVLEEGLRAFADALAEAGSR
ncbi:MAG: aminotransferase class III-fold pyridoxal phosphate-dependent enzyme [Kofleriaceae bacterium]|nr:aminotransferase class III-fold pyridoxal phosphate-dependent enzyme [Kofleriaceae bacterium]